MVKRSQVQRYLKYPFLIALICNKFFRLYNSRLHVHGYHGNAGDSMTLGENHDNQPFSTHDRDHDSRFYDNCAEHYHGAWWFKSCFQSHLNGRYYTKVGCVKIIINL